MPTKKEIQSGLTADRLKQVLNYNPETGIFTWAVKTSTRAMPGFQAGTIRGDGYPEIQIDGTRFLAHRLAWLYVQGEWPKEYLDHINRVRADNRFSNLRECSAAENQHNRPANKRNRTGLKGVTYRDNEKVYVAKIGFKGKSLRIGQYETAAAAHEAYKAKAKELFGEFASGG